MNRHFLKTPSLFAAAAAIVLHSASPQLSAAEKRGVPTTCSVRVWSGFLGEVAAVRVGLRSSGKKGAPLELAARAEPYRLGEYADIPSLNGMVEFGVAGAKQPAGTLPVQLLPGSFTTLIVQDIIGKLTAVAIDDSIGYRETATLTVRNFSPQLSHLRIQAGPDVQARFASPASFLQASGLPRTRIEVETSGDESNGQALHWTNDIDFTKVLRATVVILPDPYGRLRPRVMVDGQNATLAGEGVPKPAQ